ncbi:class I SAM-dependent methyltransferase [Desulfovibrio sp. OttesenSCG-928-C06]|nr:class I SAM-dependent methyltransferase [Desulfovibrio sp. OttesenSCG-928-C06]
MEAKDVRSPIHPFKADLVEIAIGTYGIKSIVDVGGCFGVHGGYTFHALKNGVERAMILDGEITPDTVEQARRYPNLTLKTMDLGNRDEIAALPSFDAAIIYDVLLHQVDPDWDEFLALYAAKVDTLIIYNQDFVGDETFRFVDRGLDWYLEQEFAKFYGKESITNWFARHDQIHPQMGKKNRDIHGFWQWGIAYADIIRVAHEQGFRLDYFINEGSRFFGDTIDCHAYMFHRKN